jgi:hypothetical protein
LEKELRKVTQFYEAEELKLLGELEVLQEQITQQEEAGLEGDYYEERYRDDIEEEDEEDEDERGSLGSPIGSKPPTKRRRVGSSARRPPLAGMLSSSAISHMFQLTIMEIHREWPYEQCRTQRA